MIYIGFDYAFITAGQRYSEPLKALVLDNPRDGFVRVEIQHPDEHVPGSIERVRTSDLHGQWDELPLAGCMEGAGNTWAQIADATHRHSQSQRALVRRLRAFGIQRNERHYAGKGGLNRIEDYSGVRSMLVLTHDELAALLEIAEAGAAISGIKLEDGE